ncbi:MAG: transcription elongation factor GreA [Acidobacteriota bacterium]|nr:transcription elongation factor GreA [Acidobacteriota bacterium]MDQ7088274.1 transcription elongation factor GreA [Acidobacteriota bacterium]
MPLKRITSRVEQELRELERELRVELPREIERATALGDLRENAEYHAALERQRYLQARVGQLQQRLSQLSTIRISSIPTDRAAFGSILKVEDLDTGEEKTFELVIGDDGDPATGKISISSPIGRSLVGRVPGDEVTVRTPGGERVFEILELTTLHQRDIDDD